MAKIGSLTLLVVGVLTACSGGDDAAANTTSTTTTTMAPVAVPVESRAGAYFEALAANDPTVPAAGSATPGSQAALYAEHQAATRELLGLDSPRSVVVGNRGFEICDADAACVTYGAVVTDPVSGLVNGFSIDGVPLAGRIVGGGLVADRDGVVARIASAYQTTGGDTFVVVEIDNTTDVALELFGFAAVLESRPTGVETTGAWGASTFGPGASGDLLMLFPSTEIGGRVRLSGLRSDGLDIALDVRLPTP